MLTPVNPPGLLPANNLSDVANAATARANLGVTAGGETVASPAISGGTLTLDLNSGGNTIFTVSLNANITTLAFSNVPAAGSFLLRFTYNGTGYSVTWGASVLWPSGIAPTLTNTNAKTDTFAFYTTDTGTTWEAFVSGQNQ